MELFRSNLSQYRSSAYETARGLLRSRNTQRTRAMRRGRQVAALKAENRQLQRSLQAMQRQLQQAQQLLDQEMAGRHAQDSQPPANPLHCDLPLASHSFGAKMIALCIGLAQKIGFRPAKQALEIIFNALNINIAVPSYSSIRSWTCRLGIGELEEAFGDDQDVLWMADHSSQIGSERVLLIIGIAVADLPELGSTLCLEDMKVLAIVPGTCWKREDVRREYQKLAERIGPPRYLLCDGAVELRDPVDVLEKAGRKPIVLGDLKHHAANVLEKQIGRSDRFVKFVSQVGLTRNRIQQTEMSHFVPPPMKQKSRFMNLGPLLRWGAMVSYHLSHPHSEARQGIRADRMNEKLGWLREYRDDLACWNACHEIVQQALGMINCEGLYVGVSEKLHAVLEETACRWPVRHEVADQVAALLVKFVKESEGQLEADQRAWLSTEILESLFGRFKQLEGQHSKGGFTSLLAALPSLIVRWTAERVRSRLPTIPVERLKRWVKEYVGQTLTARRTAAYQEFRPATPG